MGLVVVGGQSSQTVTSGSRLMCVGSPLDTQGCDWCMLSCYGWRINTSQIMAVFTFGDLLQQLPTPPRIKVTIITIHVIFLFYLGNQFFKGMDFSRIFQVIFCMWNNKKLGFCLCSEVLAVAVALCCYEIAIFCLSKIFAPHFEVMAPSVLSAGHSCLLRRASLFG